MLPPKRPQSVVFETDRCSSLFHRTPMSTAEPMNQDYPHMARDMETVFQGVSDRLGGRIAPVVAHVEHDHVEALAERAPERQVAVDGETVAMAEQQAHRRVHVTVAADADDRPVLHREVELLDCFGNLHRHELPPAAQSNDGPRGRQSSRADRRMKDSTGRICREVVIARNAKIR